MTPGQWRERAAWVREYLEANPEASVDEIARAAEKADQALPKEVISQTRRDFRLARTYGHQPVQRTPPTPFTVVVETARCTRCGEAGHWVSQCSEVVEPPLSVIEPKYVVVESDDSFDEDEDPFVAASEPVKPAAEPQPEKPVMEPQMVRPQSDMDVGRTRTVEGTIVRRRRLNEIVEAQPDIHPMQAIVQLRNEFGIGLDFNYTYETVRIARELNGLQPLRSREDASERDFGEREKVTVIAREEDEQRLTPDEELEWMATRISEIVRAHNLSDVNIRTENGSLVWDYEIRLRKSGKKAL